jgi:hypothetical protein
VIARQLVRCSTDRVEKSDRNKVVLGKESPAMSATGSTPTNPLIGEIFAMCHNQTNGSAAKLN